MRCRMLYAYAATTLSDTISPDVCVSIRLQTQPCFLDSCSTRVASQEQDDKKKNIRVQFATVDKLLFYSKFLYLSIHVMYCRAYQYV